MLACATARVDPAQNKTMSPDRSGCCGKSGQEARSGLHGAESWPIVAILMMRRSGTIARSSVEHAPGQLAQARWVEQYHLAAIDRDELLLAETAKHAADGFRRKAQIVGDIGPRHAEAEFGAGQAARRVSVAQVDEKCREPFVRGMIARQQRRRAELLAEQAEQVLLDLGLARGQRAHRGER